MAKKEAQIVAVKATGDNGKVVLWERDDAHPEGEIFLSNDGKVRKAALTRAVKKRIQDGLLEIVEDEDVDEPAPKAKSKAKDDGEPKGGGEKAPAP